MSGYCRTAPEEAVVIGPSRVPYQVSTLSPCRTASSGQLRYEVRAATGTTIRRYSKSVNLIPFHTEAPGRIVPPAMLALHCRRQATYERDIHWIDRDLDGASIPGLRRPLVEVRDDGTEIHRFRQSLVTTGEYPPGFDTESDAPLGDQRESIQARIEDYFPSNQIAILIPDNAILVWNNQRMTHARPAYTDPQRHLTRYWVTASPGTDS
jgi:Taurine catabolism dioxygenase TauD, TfdA family